MLRLKQRKQEYDELMDKLQQEAFLHLVKLEREEAERQAERDGRERRRKKEILNRKKRMLEAAFEGETDEIKNVRVLSSWLQLLSYIILDFKGI